MFGNNIPKRKTIETNKKEKKNTIDKFVSLFKKLIRKEKRYKILGN